MNRLNRLHAEQQEDCSSIWGQQLRRRGHQTESSRKAVSTPICSFSRFSLNEVMNIVYTVCFIEKLYCLKQCKLNIYLTVIISSRISVLSRAIITMLQIGPTWSAIFFLSNDHRPMIQSTAFPRVPLMSYRLPYRMSYNSVSPSVSQRVLVQPSITLSKRNRSKEGRCVNFQASLGRNRSNEGRCVN